MRLFWPEQNCTGQRQRWGFALNVLITLFSFVHLTTPQIETVLHLIFFHEKIGIPNQLHRRADGKKLTLVLYICS
jgi:hypothetical protein